eukprot:COSAG05_NODE_2038_length_3653_cov_2.553180_2_plen_649_part_00
MNKPVWRCAQQCRMAATERLYLAEAVAQGGNSWHLNGYMQSSKIPPSESDEGTWGGANYTAFGYVEHLAMVNFTNQHRFLFSDRTRLADVAVLYSLSSVFWRRAGVLSRGVNRTHEQHLTAVCRFLEDTHEAYEIVALGHADLWENPLGTARLSQPVGSYRMVIVPSVDALSDADLQLLSSYAQSGGQLIITGTEGPDATAARDENLRPRGPDALRKLMTNPGQGSVRALKTFARYLACTTATCAAARDALREELGSEGAMVQYEGTLPSNVWVSSFSHGAGPMSVVHLTNYNVNGTVGTLTCRTCKLHNIALQKPVQVSISMNATGLTATAVAKLYQPGLPVQTLTVTSHEGRLRVTIPRMDVYSVVAFATAAEFAARELGAETRRWLQRSMISARSSGLPSSSQLDSSALLKADKLLATLQGEDAVRANQRSDGFFLSTGAALQYALPPLQAYVAAVQARVTSTVDASLGSVVDMCSGTKTKSCLAAFSFEQTARRSYKPAAKVPQGFVSVVGSPVYDGKTAFGFTDPPASTIQSRFSPLQSFDTLLPDDLHRGGIMSNESATFQIDLQLEAPLPKELLLTIISGWHDLGAPNRSAHGGFDKSNSGAWMSFASTGADHLQHTPSYSCSTTSTCMCEVLLVFEYVHS